MGSRKNTKTLRQEWAWGALATKWVKVGEGRKVRVSLWVTLCAIVKSWNLSWEHWEAIGGL